MLSNVDCPSDAEMFPNNVDRLSNAETLAAFEAMNFTIESGDSTSPFEGTGIALGSVGDLGPFIHTSPKLNPDSYYAQSPYEFEMASPSSKKIMERQPKPQGVAATPGAQQINKGKDDLHVALPADLIEKLKSAQNWGNKFRRTYDEEKVRRVWEIQQSMDFDDLSRHVMYGDGMEVVWEHDIWNLQSIVQPQVAKSTAKKDDDGDDVDAGGGDEDDEKPQSPMVDKPNKDAD